MSMADVGCAGILVADMFCGPMKQLPATGQLTVLNAFPTRLGGCAGNVAVGLAKQQISVDVVGCVGADAQAQVIVKAMQAAMIGCDQIATVADEPTSQTVILLVEGEDRRFIHVFGANKRFSIGQIHRNWVRSLKVFYLGGLFVLPGIDMDELIDLLRFCRQHQVTTVVDVVVPERFEPDNTTLQNVLGHVDYFLPNDDEAEHLTGQTDPDQQIRTFQAWGVGTVIITRGQDGLTAGGAGKLWRCGVYPTEVVDPTGGGDAFAAGVITAAVGNWPMPKLLAYASALGASCTRKVGCTDGVLTRRETESFCRSHELAIGSEDL